MTKDIVPKEYLILNEISSKINEAINEELGISDEVKDKSAKLRDDVINRLKNIEKTIIDSGVSEKKDNFQIEIANKKVFVQVHYYNFRDNTYYLNFIKKHGNIEHSSTSNDGRFNVIILNFYSISGYIDKIDLYDSIQHEVEHIFQQVKAKKTFGNSNLYLYAYNSLNSDQIEKRILALISYMSNSFEQDGYVNGLYAFLKENYRFNSKRFDVKESPVYNKLTDLIYAKDFLIKNKNNANLQNEISYYKDKFNLNYNDFIRLVTSSINEITKKIGKTIIKFKNDMMKSGTHYAIPKKLFGENINKNSFYYV